MTSLGDAALDALTSAGLDPAEVERIVLAALHEDLVLGPDLTTEATVPAGATATADVVARRRRIPAAVLARLAPGRRRGLPRRRRPAPVGTARAAADVRADDAQPADSPVGRRHPDPSLGR